MGGVRGTVNESGKVSRWFLEPPLNKAVQISMAMESDVHVEVAR
jgi:hypothetical protein